MDRELTMELLVTYDVDTTTPDGARRLRRVAKVCEAYGLRVQKSVFEIVCSDVDWMIMKKRLLDVIDGDQDSIRVYQMNVGALGKAQHLGRSPEAPHGAPLIY
ncbi:CRISPR-associated endonuclease Cas2 [Actinoalloteichus sp. GBA129-24]|uniref:CRISPR-associated endonuclease Cas2 n=1 Tax=Actinoalloteichus sp. GBA129-24 TaxID=1612551 RepID=UPI0009516DC8|nr:CRISPR-associated endonuclease Cas2 [Actinoalloteichus sp. GBA129-24]